MYFARRLGVLHFLAASYLWLAFSKLMTRQMLFK